MFTWSHFFSKLSSSAIGRHNVENCGALLEHRSLVRSASLMTIVVLILSACAPCGYSEQALRQAPPGDPIVIGMSAAFTGPIARIGEEARRRPQTAIAEVNKAGGIGGRPLTLVALDDAYEPSRTIPNMHALIKVRYERNTLAVENALADLLLLDPPPKAVIMVGTYAPCAEFIRLAHNLPKEAHTLKGASGSIGAMRLQKLALALQAADEQDLTRCQSAYSSLRMEVEEVHKLPTALVARSPESES